MAKPPPRPQNALVVRTYQELGRYVSAFAAGKLNLLIVVGRPGLAKSQALRQAVGPQACWLEGNASAFGMYGQLYRYRDELVVIDDVDSLYANQAGVRLLKCLCQTDPVKRLAWQSAATALDKEGIPRAFETTSKVAILSNDWRTLNANVAAVQDRGHVLLFEPTAREVHGHASVWFDDQEIYDWLGRHLPFLAEPSLRHYVRAKELKEAGLDWRQGIPLKEISSKTHLVAELQRDASFATEEARAAEFVSRGAGCRATYFNHARKLRQMGLAGERETPPQQKAA